ncbi:MAG TPA: hypothetical protein VKZ63_15010, partial [Kofleriaceae bacterium]|nr:hypothetical protein [Kofleriaceae bacterium]
MRFSLAEARAPRFEIDLTGSGDGARTISLTDLIDVTLELESGGGRTRIRSLRGVSAVLDQLEWPLPRGGRVTASSRGALSAVAIELDTTSSGAGPSATGRGAVGRVEAGAVTLELPGGQRLAVDVGARALGVEHSPERVGHVTAERVDLNNLQTSLAGWLVRLSSAVLER